MIFIILLFISPEIPHDEIYELEDIAVIAMDNNLATEEWVVILKEKTSAEQIQKYLTMFKKDYLVKHTQDEDVMKYIIYKDEKVNDIDVMYEITIPQDRNNSPELVATIKGTHLSDLIVEEYKNVLKHVRNQFFTNNYMQFTCLIASKNGKIASDDFSKKLSNNLDLKYISTQSDLLNGVSYQETIYGYTQKWKNEIIIENKPLNIQIVIQGDKDEKQTVIIGTPLLITEY